MKTKFNDKVFKGMTGAHAAMFTPFDAKGRINCEAIDALSNLGSMAGFRDFILPVLRARECFLRLKSARKCTAAQLQPRRGE